MRARKSSSSTTYVGVPNWAAISVAATPPMHSRPCWSTSALSGQIEGSRCGFIPRGTDGRSSKSVMPLRCWSAADSATFLTKPSHPCDKSSRISPSVGAIATQSGLLKGGNRGDASSDVTIAVAWFGIFSKPGWRPCCRSRRIFHLTEVFGRDERDVIGGLMAGHQQRPRGLADRNPQWQLWFLGGVDNLGRDLFGGDHPLARSAAFQDLGIRIIGQRVGGHIVEGPGAHGAGFEQGRLYAEGRNLDGQGFDERLECPLRRGVRRAGREHDAADDAGHEHQLPVATSAHLR